MPVVFTSAIGHPAGDERGNIPPFGRLVTAVSQTPQVLLDMQVVEKQTGLLISWDAVDEAFPSEVLDQAFTALIVLTAGLTESTDEAWHQNAAPRLPARQGMVRSSVNGVVGDVPGGLLHARVFEACERWSGRDAVVWSGGAMSFGQVRSRSLRVGRVLRDVGVGRGEPVVVCARKGWEQVVGVLGVLAGGGAYVPLDPDLPGERLQALIERTGARVVLTQQAVANGVQWPQGVRVLALDDDEAWAGVVEESLEWVQEPTDLAYVIFTSGSTGQPKGVMIDHRGAVNTVVDINKRFSVTAGDRVLALSSLSFDLSVWDIFGVLAAGGAVVLPDPAGTRDPAHWADLVRGKQVTIWNSVPALLELFVEHLCAHDEPDLPLRLALLSGDWIPLTLPDRARARAAGLKVVSLGGATEASIWSIAFPIGDVDPQWRSIPYGWPLTNQRFRVLDSRLRDRPDFVPGELFIGGVGVAMGYWRDEERTAASFVTIDGERWYRTGDLGRYLPDGTIEFLGREDFQVKIGGYRIELGEIEAALLALEQIESAVVHAWGQPGGPRRLAAYIVPGPGHEPDADEIRRQLAQKLPAYMVPAAIVVLDALPLTGNGKIDRKALPEPGEVVRTPYTPPSSPAEHILVEIWGDLLDSDRIGIHDNLFELGADSLLALRAVAAADTAGLHLQLNDIFANPTIATQATHTTQTTITADQGIATGATLMTPNQEWFLEQDLPDRHHWNDASFLLSLQQPLDITALRRAAAHLIEHHDALRLRFEETPQGWQACLAEPGPEDEVPLSVHTFPDLSVKEQKEAVTETCQTLQRTMDLAQGPVIRLAYFDLGARPHCLLVLGHWLAVDHYSARILLEDLLSAYAQCTQTDQPPQLPAKTTSFPQWTAALNEHARSPLTQAEREFWTSRPTGQPLVIDRPHEPNRLEDLKTLTLRLDLDLTQAVLQDIPAATGADILDVLCTTLVRALPLDGDAEQRETLVDLERHGRDITIPGLSVSRTVGRLSTITPTLISVSAQEADASQLKSTHTQLESVPQRGMGYGLLRYTAKDPAVRATPTAQVGLNYVGQVDEVFLRSDLLSVPRMSFGDQHSSTGTRFRDLDVLGYVVGRRLTFTIGYSAARFDDATIGSFADQFTAQLSAIADSAHRGRVIE
jgi:amino acid adenylation domain-containing protein/non-ribosomal peptide synthase protein (TIGR01720 family)